MAISPKTSTYQPAELDELALLSIGRIVRACAELEDMLTLFICNLASTPVGAGVVMLGRTPFSARLTMARYLAKMKGGEDFEAYKRIFESSLTNGTTCRNAVCHGVLLGIDQNGHYGFLTTKTADPEPKISVQLVENYSSETLRQIAAAMEAGLARTETLLKIGPLRQIRQGRSLERRHKGQPQRPPSVKPKRPPPPSPQ